MMKKTLLALSVASLLTACGESSSSDSPTTDRNTVEYRVIDGYLSNADVCIIAVGETLCVDIGSTDENGVIKIDKDIISGQLIATIKAGETKDADSVGFVGKSYQMVAEISVDSPNVVTPFTTLDVLDTDKTLAEIANELDLSEELLSGDYLASNDTNKAHVHALARALVTQLAVDKDDNNTGDLLSKTEKVNDYIVNEFKNNDIDLDSQNIIFEDNGELRHEPAISKLADFLEAGPRFLVSLNGAYYRDEGARPLTFKDGVTYLDGKEISYEIMDNILISDGNGKDEFIYVSNYLSLSVPWRSKDLTAISSAPFGVGDDEEREATWAADDLIGNTFYLIFDDQGKGKSIKPTFVKMVFSASTVIITEGDEVNSVAWQLEGGLLKLETEELDRNITYAQSVSDQNITLIKDIKAGMSLSVMVQDENLAKSIFAKWISAAN